MLVLKERLLLLHNIRQTICGAFNIYVLETASNTCLHFKLSETGSESAITEADHIPIS